MIYGFLTQICFSLLYGFSRPAPSSESRCKSINVAVLVDDTGLTDTELVCSANSGQRIDGDRRR